MNCHDCGAAIDEQRLEILPNTTTCTACSKEPKRLCFLVFDHKTAPYVVDVNGADPVAVDRALRCHRRAR